jgi:predicted nucleotidyltransferase component of viral defense system
MPAPNLQVYPKYTVVAEKLEAIITMGMANTRMKDYFDLWIILKGSQLDREILAQAVTATLSRRNTQRPASIPTGLCDQFSADRQKMTQWAAFVKRNDLVAASLEETIKDIRSALMFLFQEATG